MWSATQYRQGPSAIVVPTVPTSSSISVSVVGAHPLPLACTGTRAAPPPAA
jgi:hypothetical protein